MAWLVFIAGLIRGHPLRDCVQLGCQIAAYAVTGTGAYMRIPRDKEEYELSVCRP